MADNANSSESATANEDTAIKPNTTADDANAWGSAAANDASWGTKDATAKNDDWETTDKDNTGQGSWADVPKENAGLLPLEAIRLAKINSVAVLTDLNGKSAKIGGLTTATSPACVVFVEGVIGNRETYLYLLGRFPRSPAEGHPNPQQFRYMGFRFYGDSFHSFDRDFLLTPITEAEKLPDILKDDEPMIAAMAEKGDLYKLDLTYQPNKVVTLFKDDPEEFSMPESSYPAQLLRHLVEGETPKTLTLCFRAKASRVKDLNNLRDGLKHKRDILPFQEYRNSKGKIVITYGAAGFNFHSPVMQKMQSTFRTADQHATTLAYGEMSDYMRTVELARSTLSASVEISFVAVPGYVDKNQLPTKYIGFVDIMDTELIGQLFQAGATATLCFDEPNKFVEPKGWLCEVKPEIPNVEHPGNLTLLVSRPKDSDLVVKTAKFPSLDMIQESKYDVWVYPHGDDTACKRLVDCANKYLHGEEKESNAHLEKRMALQRFCSGREHTAMPKPTGISFDRNKLTAEQLAELETIEAECSPDQRAVLDKIYSCQSAVHVVQGPPGSGKTWFAAKILVPILKIFGLKANCYASSNAATDAFADKIPLKLKPIRYHDPPKEWSIGIKRVSTAEIRPCDNAAATLSEEQRIWMQAYNDAASSISWNIPTEVQYPNFSSRGLHVRALQRAKLMDKDGQLSDALPKDVPEAYLQWARQYYRLDKRVIMPPKDGDDDKPTFYQLTMRLFDDTLRSADYVITTCSNAADKRLRRCTNPRVVIIDEAGSARELETLMAMYHNLESADMFIILGDANQSPVVPTLHHKVNDDDPSSPPYNRFAPQLATSLMARQIANGIRHSTFTKI